MNEIEIVEMQNEKQILKKMGGKVKWQTRHSRRDRGWKAGLKLIQRRPCGGRVMDIGMKSIRDVGNTVPKVIKGGRGRDSMGTDQC